MRSPAQRKVRARLRPLHRRLAGLLPLRWKRMYLYLVSVNRIPRTADPRTFTEKVNWRILHDRRPRIAHLCDKLHMKEHARALLGPSDLHIAETYWSGTDLREVPEEVWKRDWILKPNHSSGRVIRAYDGLDRETVIRRAAPWLQEDLSVHLGEWGYSLARKVYVMEQRVPGPPTPTDYKIYVFDGRIAMIQVDTERFGPKASRNVYDIHWNPVPVQWVFPRGPEVPRPAALDSMLETARILAAGWDHMRVDLYLDGDDVWFGEFSPYSQGGMMKLRPRSMDRVLGDQWTLPQLSAEHLAR